MELEHERKYMTLLIADDSEDIRDHLAIIVQRIDGIEAVWQAETSDEAVKSARKFKPDIAILDIKMPGGGINALKEIKENNLVPIVIMFTGYPDPQYRTKCIELGADYFFNKSTEFEKIQEVLEQIISDSSNHPANTEK